MTSMPRPALSPAPAFGLDHYFRLPRVSGLVLSPDGRRLVATVATAAPDGKRFVDALWELDPDGKARDDAGVGALLFESYPIRYWDHYLGPREPRLFAATAPPADDGRIEPPPSLTPNPGWALEDASFDLTPDGGTVVTTWEVDDDVRNPRAQLVSIEVGSGRRRVLIDDVGSTVGELACSPDGRQVVCQRLWPGTTEATTRVTLWLIDLVGGEGRDLLPDSELLPGGPVWTPDGAAVLFHSDEQGRAPVFRVELDGGAVTRLSADGSFSHLCPAPDGRRLYALRNAISSPPGAVVLATSGADQPAEPVPTPGLPLDVPSSVTEVRTAAADGVPLRAWLVLPADASPSSPAPLVTFVHGGPVASWSGWTWRWNAPLLAARGYAVLLPDPGLSTGYGEEFVGRGRGRWGAEPYSDLMALIEATEARADIDETRTAAMGGSFGGYMANWVAGNTDRFRCIITHASIWSLEPFRGTTDSAAYWDREFGTPEDDPARYREHSPDRLAGAIRTPMLVIHGEKDYRVPIGEALRLWTDLKFRGMDAPDPAVAVRLRVSRRRA